MRCCAPWARVPWSYFFPGGHCSAVTPIGADLYTELGFDLIVFSRPGYGRTDVGPLNAAEFVPAVRACVFPAAPVFGVAACPSAIFTAGLLLWTRRGMPMYVLVVPLVWLMAQAPADALALGVVADVARVPIGVATTAMLVWREYRAARERVVAGALLLLAIVLMGNDTVLMSLGGVYLLATLAAWYVRRHGAHAMATGEPAHAVAR